MRNVFFVTLILLVTTTIAQAKVENCYGDTTQTDINICASSEVGNKREHLDNLYRQLEKTQSPEGLQALRESKKRWEDFSSAQCKFNALSSEGGTIHSLAFAGCLDILLDNQIKVVQWNIDCQEGDFSCGGAPRLEP